MHKKCGQIVRLCYDFLFRTAEWRKGNMDFFCLSVAMFFEERSQSGKVIEIRFEMYRVRISPRYFVGVFFSLRKKFTPISSLHLGDNEYLAFWYFFLSKTKKKLNRQTA